MSTIENVANLRRLYDEVFNQGHLNVADDLIDPDVVEHQPQPGVDPNARGPEIVKQIAQSYRNVFPDLHIAVEDVVAEGDRVVARLTISGTHRGELMGILPTGKRVHFSSIDILRYEGGKAVEHWGETDVTSMMQQLGVMPSG